MNKELQMVWTSANGDELLRKKGEDKYYTPLGTMTLETLCELAAACADAVKSVEMEAEKSKEAK